jgi:hypothetical protein
MGGYKIITNAIVEIHLISQAIIPGLINDTISPHAII